MLKTITYLVYFCCGGGHFEFLILMGKHKLERRS